MAEKGSRKPAKKDAPPKDEDREGQLFIQEVNEELKQEQYLKIWKQYGRYLVGAAVVILLGVAGWQYWQSEQRSARQAESVTYAAALKAIEGNNPAEASKLLANLAQTSDGGYGALARLRRAALFAKSGAMTEAAAEYRRLADNEDAPQGFRELATLMWALSALDTAEPKAAIDRLQPLAAETSPWRFTARELTALYTDRAGDRKKAAAIFGELAKNEKAPDTIRSRAREMLSILGES